MPLYHSAVQKQARHYLCGIVALMTLWLNCKVLKYYICVDVNISRQLRHHFTRCSSCEFLHSHCSGENSGNRMCGYADSKKAPSRDHSQDGAFLLWIRANTSRRNRR